MPLTSYLINHVDLGESLPACERRVRLELRRLYLTAALQKTNGSVYDTAAVLGISRRSVTSLLAQYKIDAQQYYTPVRKERLLLYREAQQRRAAAKRNKEQRHASGLQQAD